MNFLKRRWLKWHLARSRQGHADAMSRLYCVKDPWGLDVPSEHIRFAETARLMREKLGEHFDSILEIGCGEGLQTQYLAPLANRIIGTDPSPHAVKRALAQGIANASFEVADLISYQKRTKDVFSLVTACEVMYYFKDIEEACRCMNQLGRVCVATYYQGMYDRLDGFFKARQANFETIYGPSAEWRFVWWLNHNRSESEASGD